MLETEDIEDDYFTPLPNASLKNIFGGTLQDKPIDSDLLKYSPLKAEVRNAKPVVTPATECLFACALVAHEWSENAYKSKGKLGLAIVKTIKTNSHSIILYDSSKTTLSRTTITPNLKVFLKGNSYLSFYDCEHKYWNLLAKEDEIFQITEQLKKCNVQVVCDSQENIPHNTNDKEKEEIAATTVDPSQSMNDNKQSDTDSSSNKRTKVAILNRMAIMGQSVLPRYSGLETGRKNDSESSSSTDSYSTLSHSNDNNSCKTTKPNSHAKAVRRISTSKEVAEVSKVIQHTDSSSLYPMLRGQFVPNICSSNGGELNCFISEQRISNTELRMNINKTSDKVDQILDLLRNSISQGNTNNSNFHTDIMNKLLTEYESKIKILETELTLQSKDTVHSNLALLLKEYEEKMEKYEERLKTLNTANTEMHNEYETKIGMLREQLKIEMNKNNQEVKPKKPEPCINSLSNITDKDIEIQYWKGKIHELEETVNEKQNIITKLELQTKETECLAPTLAEKENNLLGKGLSTLNEIEVINTRDTNLVADAEQQKDLITKAKEFDSKLKTVMNEVFQLASVNFEDNKQYSGEDIKTVLVAVIKKSTHDLITSQTKRVVGTIKRET